MHTIYKHKNACYTFLGNDFYNQNNTIENAKDVLNLSDFIHLTQIHSNICLTNPMPKEEADAMIITKANTGLCIKTADCLPILFYDEKNEIIAGAHAGWRGLESEVLENTITELAKYGSINNITAIIGPSIHQKHYQVQNDFYEIFLNKNKENRKFFQFNEDGSYNFSASDYAIQVLSTLGINNIVDHNYDTFSSNQYSSYRRARMEGKLKHDNSILSIIWINNNIS
jgi:YfiH family protein